ncbi:MAG: replication initiator protein A, partial [Candidatus Bipolaricaulaceae bacterium]
MAREKLSPEEIELSKAEVNILLLPVFFLSKKGEKGIIEYRGTIAENGDEAELIWRVYPGPLGPLGPFEKDVFRAMEYLIIRRPFPLENPIPFTIYEVREKMGLSHSGRTYREIKNAIIKIAQATVHSKRAFYSKKRRLRVEEVFHLYERVHFEGECLPDGTVAETNLLWLGSWYLESLNAFYLRPFDYRFYRSLESPVAKRLYEVLGFRFQRAKETGQECVRYRYSNLCQLLPITRQRFLSKAQEKLGPAHAELLAASFLAHLEWLPLGGTDWIVRYWPGPRAFREMEEVKHRTEWSPSWIVDEARQRAEDEAYVRGFASYLAEELEDPGSYGFYEMLARKARQNSVLEDLIYRVLSEVRDDFRRGRVKKNKGAAFTDRLKR